MSAISTTGIALILSGFCSRAPKIDHHCKWNVDTERSNCHKAITMCDIVDFQNGSIYFIVTHHTANTRIGVGEVETRTIFNNLAIIFAIVRVNVCACSSAAMQLKTLFFSVLCDSLCTLEVTRISVDRERENERRLCELNNYKNGDYDENDGDGRRQWCMKKSHFMNTQIISERLNSANKPFSWELNAINHIGHTVIRTKPNPHLCPFGAAHRRRLWWATIKGKNNIHWD